TAKKHAKPGPEESFQPIIETFRRRMEETPVGFVVNNSNGRSTMTGTNKVSYELFKPKTENDQWKATITVVSQSRYSVKMSTEVPDEPAKEKTGTTAERLLAEKDKKGSDSPNENFSKVTGDNAKPATTTTHMTEQVLPHSESEKKPYDLIYQD